MTDGQVIRPQDKKCPKCGKKYRRIEGKDDVAVEFSCACGEHWTAYYVTDSR